MDETNARHAALEMAVREASPGSQWDAVVRLADKFAAFIIAGTVPTNEDAEA